MGDALLSNVELCGARTGVPESETDTARCRYDLLLNARSDISSLGAWCDVELTRLLLRCTKNLLEPSQIRPFSWDRRKQELTSGIPMDLHGLVIDVWERVGRWHDIKPTYLVNSNLRYGASFHVPNPVNLPTRVLLFLRITTA